MAAPGPSRRLAAIMFTDMVGFTALSQRNEALSLELLEDQRALIRPIFRQHGGREVKTMGDGFLVEFPNALESVRCAYQIQRASREANASLPSERRVALRVGLHLGDVVDTAGDISGDAVNVAARIEPLAEPGGICLTRQMYDQVQNKFEQPMISLGAKSLKNVSAPLEVFRVTMPGERPERIEDAEVDRNRIAVLPLANFSPDPSDAYFADGLTDEIISTISGIPGLTVISRTSVMQYKQAPKSMTAIGRELRAGKILEGSVRKSGNRVRITVQLIDSESDAHLWTQSLDGNLDSVFETQSDIARQIAEALKLPTPRAASHAENPEAYTLCLQARSLWNRRRKEANDQAIMLFDEARKLDPGSARPLAGMACCYNTAADWGWLDAKEAYLKAGSLARRAIELDPTLPEAHLALADVIAQDDWPGAEVEIKKALALNPSNADAHESYGAILRGMGRLDEALDHARKAYDLDPVPLSRGFFLVISYWFADRTDDALAVCNRLIQTEPGYSTAYLGRAIFTAIKGDREQPYRDMETFRRLTNETNYLAGRARVEAHLGNKEASSRLIAEALARFESGQFTAEGYPYQVSFAFALIGDREGFFRSMGYLIDHKMMGPGELRDPSYRGMRDDPRFAEILQKVRKSYGIPD